ncbi:hypothetical protein ACPPVO_32705 [Dactylosporangium sp. McL0621]|uniref:hypothetical protein n=1 Tax=Dactylosporangium sp. McL0621 TaxID=3415678 RepID=UPI003CEC0837
MTEDRDPYRHEDTPQQPYDQPVPYTAWADPYSNDDARQPRNPYGSPPGPYLSDGDVRPPPYPADIPSYPTGAAPPGPYLSDLDSTGRTAGPRSVDRDPLLVRLWRRITGSR